MISIVFDKGTLVIDNISPEQKKKLSLLTWDHRIKKYRLPALAYRDLILSLRAHKFAYHDSAKNFLPVALQLQKEIIPRPHQTAALDAWCAQGSRGLVILPTGSGKTILAIMAIAKTNRPTLVHVPTKDLMWQWYHELGKYFSVPIGLLGDGERDIQNITVATYDSALINVPFLGNRFGLLIFDECHHLPSAQMQYCALSAISPFRLGLSATPATDEREVLLIQLCGPFCFQAHIHELAGNILAPYTIITQEIQLTPEEQEQYLQARKVYTAFLKAQNIDFSHSLAWSQFIRKIGKSAEGKAAFQAYLLQKKISQSAQNKILALWDIFCKHSPSERILIFTQDNETAYNLGRHFFLPVLTQHTKVREREQFLNAFRNGSYRILISSKVLNEGVDVPEASVAIVFSGSGTVREHVQRLGRILRAQAGKKAVLYELIAADTGEYFINQRRKQHAAYTANNS